ncbi:class I SAM-dependent methyltransferase [Rheinheimera sp.]|uniref:class I SAM-dependent methyltransferase n=1 Tax=Rheinheimera sp. TaxID=1869214 RepID=UPI0027B91629|nr:class I SAM-dependent methyltransferase [Rheinheimera sp.]
MELDVNVDIYDNFSSEYIKVRLTEGALFNEHIESPVVRDFIKDIKSFKRVNVLDVGCGPGVYTKSFYKMGANVVAIDPSETMIDAARKYCGVSSGHGTYNIDFKPVKLMDYHNDRDFYLVLATFMLGYFDDLRSSFKKMEEMLGRSGRIVTSSLHPERLFAVSKNDTGYLSGDNNRNKKYEADFLGKDAVIHLNKYSFEQIFDAASDAGLKVTKMKEPLLPADYNYHDKLKVDFYSRNHSIAVFELKRKSKK